MTRQFVCLVRWCRRRLPCRRRLLLVVMVTMCLLISSIIFVGRPSTRALHAADVSYHTDAEDDRQLLKQASQSPTTTLLPLCDNECSRFRRLFDAWPADKPRGAIVLLLRRQSIPVFARSAKMLHTNFNDAYRYPIIIFHESDLDPEPERDRLRSSAADRSLLFFQRVVFDIPPFINRSAVPHRVCFKTVGYRHMCRFHAITIYNEPILAGLRYVWRLDDDSYIFRPVGYDVFRFMLDRRIRYGYAAVRQDYGPCIVGLWPAADRYAKEHGLKQRFRWPRGRMFWNNFEVSDMEMWRSEEYRDYVEYIDQLGGIYYRRWGDATIKTIAVTLFAFKNETHHFKDISYAHGKRVKFDT